VERGEGEFVTAKWLGEVLPEKVEAQKKEVLP